MIRKLILVLTLILLVGCQKDFDDGRGGANPDGSVRFSLKTDDDAIYPDNVMSRGVPHNSLDEYDSVFVNVFSHTSDYWASTGNDVKFFREIKLNQQDEEWKYTPPMYWPVDEKLSFIAYASDVPFADANISFSPEKGAPKTITYSVPSDVTKQPDLLISTKYNQQKVGNVSLNMIHALACVSFCGTAPKLNTYVKSITLRNVYSRGTLTLDAPSIEWDLDLDSKGLTALEPGIETGEELGEDPLQDNDYLMTANGYLMMIPQKLTNAAIDVLYWNGKDDKDNKTMTYVLPVGDDSYATWRPGKRYIYKFGSQAEDDITVVYYEKYADNSYGLYYYDNRTESNSIIDEKEIIEAGYGVLTTSSIGPVAPIGLGAGSSIASGSVVGRQ